MPGSAESASEPRQALARAEKSRAEDARDLLEELRFASVGTQPAHRADCLDNAEWLGERLGRLGLRTCLARPYADGLPIVIGEWLQIPGAPVLTIYGHYDVQPAEPVAEWETPPFEPMVRHGRIYARGAADNKGNHLAAVKAVQHLLAAGELPLNVRFIIEGEEEHGGPSLPAYVSENADSLRSDYLLLWDGGFHYDGRPAITTGLRGLLNVELEATGPATDLHSALGGAAPNPVNTLARIIGELKGRDGRITIPGFYDQVKPASDEEQRDWAGNAGTENAYLRLTGARALEGEEGYTLTERLAVRPTLDVTGITGGYTGAGHKTVIPARCLAKITLRLVPDQDPEQVYASLADYVPQLSTPGVRLSTRMLSSARPVFVGAANRAAAALTEAYMQTYESTTALRRSGGSIPVMEQFDRRLPGTVTVISGITEADSRLHAPNENLRLGQYHLGIRALIRFIHNLGPGR